MNGGRTALPSNEMRYGPLCLGGMSLLLVAAPVSAQFAQLAATDDGRQLYFTSQLLLKGATATPSLPWPEYRLYRWTPDGVTLFAERGQLAALHSGSSGSGATGPQVSGDGAVVGFTLNDVCLTDPECMSTINESYVRGSVNLDAGPGTLQLSRNGRWALLTRQVLDPNPGGPAAVPTYTSTLTDLSTGQRTDVPPPPIPTPFFRTVASDGTLLVNSGGKVGLWKQGQFTPTQFPLAYIPWGLSDDASTIFATGTVPVPDSPSGPRLMAFQVASGTISVLFQATGPMQLPYLMGASNDGRLVLYRVGTSSASGPAYVADVTTGKSTAIALPDGELVSDGTLTGRGDTAFLATTRGRIVKVALAAGTVESLFPAVPYCDNQHVLAAGSLAFLTCTVDLPSDAQSKVMIDGEPAPVLASNPGQIAIQVPWEARPGSDILSFDLPALSPFASGQMIQVGPAAPYFLPAPPGERTLFGFAIVKGDWSGLVTTQPGPGDIVHVYMTGLGPVMNPTQTGVPASLTQANPIQGTFTCQFFPQKSPAETLFAGLAPGMIGIYQVTFRMPPDAGQAPITGLMCRSDYGGMTVAGLGGTPAAPAP